MIHYDQVMREGKSVSLSLLEALPLDTATLPTPKRFTVNRSLSVTEAKFMRVANQCYKDQYQQPSFGFSAALSDELIRSDPELPTEAFLDKAVVAHLKESMQHQVDFVNRRFFKETALMVFDPNGKQYTEDGGDELSADFRRVIKVLIQPQLVQYHPDNLDETSWLKKDRRRIGLQKLKRLYYRSVG